MFLGTHAYLAHASAFRYLQKLYSLVYDCFLPGCSLLHLETPARYLLARHGTFAPARPYFQQRESYSDITHSTDGRIQVVQAARDHTFPDWVSYRVRAALWALKVPQDHLVRSTRGLITGSVGQPRLTFEAARRSDFIFGLFDADNDGQLNETGADGGCHGCALADIALNALILPAEFATLQRVFFQFDGDEPRSSEDAIDFVHAGDPNFVPVSRASMCFIALRRSPLIMRCVRVLLSYESYHSYLINLPLFIFASILVQSFYQNGRRFACISVYSFQTACLLSTFVETLNFRQAFPQCDCRPAMILPQLERFATKTIV